MFAVLQVALTNLLLSSDNVLMIALMSHRVRRGHRWYALLWSLLASLALQLGILLVMAFLFHFPFLKSVFGVVICLMAFHLILTHQPHAAPTAEQGVSTAVVRITAGNLLMSFENEVALITLAHGSVWLAWLGVLTTSPFIFFGSHMMVTLLRRYPLIVYAGAVYLFSVGARLLFSNPWLQIYATIGTWTLTALFAMYVAVRYLARVRATPRVGGAQ